MLNCQELQDLILPYAAGALEETERQAVAAHLATGCPKCAGALAEAQALIARIPLGLDSVTPSTAAKHRLMKRVSRRSPMHIELPSIPAAIAALVATVVILAITTSLHKPPSSGIALISMEADAPSTAKAQIFWDKATNKWNMVAYGLRPLPANKTYELWFITADQKKIRAGEFDPDRKGSAALSVAVPADIGPIALAAVTDEPAGGVDQPTGKIQMKGLVK